MENLRIRATRICSKKVRNERIPGNQSGYEEGQGIHEDQAAGDCWQGDEGQEQGGDGYGQGQEDEEECYPSYDYVDDEGNGYNSEDAHEYYGNY